ncbi:hypothetical protein [Fictibacillus barbaricus]|uniref:Uncharacterized protein n=1 Tax=Fictibacillus barbaricus TaxID=182136 RepID=A0ABU1U649_9BACL|nr:hypothetical protein [Fictibacillus barbaricus]MDR7074969.1 hypothetical protein [Fictibacillus barbaricus]
MLNLKNKPQFPGEERGIVRVYIYRDTEKESAQLNFHFFDEISDNQEKSI